MKTWRQAVHDLRGSLGAAGTEPQGPVLGEGIGLSIVKQLCGLLNASIELKTEPGRGTTFRVVFPARYELRAYKTAASRRTASSSPEVGFR